MQGHRLPRSWSPLSAHVRARLAAFTRIELAVVLAVVSLLAILWLPAHAITASKAQRLHCADNLKRVGVAFYQWAEKKEGRYPMRVSGVNGGPWLSTAGPGSGTTIFATANNAQFTYQVYAVMSNELATPKILVCPADDRLAATNFGPQLRGPTGNLYVSYFVGVTTDPSTPRALLAGDRNIGNTANPTFPPTSTTIGLGTNSTSLQWTERMHQKNGNVALSDGSVQLMTSAELREATRTTGGFPNAFTPSTSFGVPSTFNVISLP
jgi:hypothetical protein